MIKNTLRQILLFWLIHPWRVFWGTFAGFYVVGLLLIGRPSDDVKILSYIAFGLVGLVLATSFILGLRASWKKSPIKAAGILAVWGAVPILSHGGAELITSAGGIAVLLCWIFIPALLAVATEYVGRVIQRRTGLDATLR